MIAFTNHALDHMLSSVLDAKITSDIVRLGSRSSDERISEYSIEVRERVVGQSALDKTLSHRHRETKEIQEQIKKLMQRILNADLESNSIEVTKYLNLYYPEHLECLHSPPGWIEAAQRFASDDDEGGSWKVQGRKGRAMVQDTSIYGFWKRSADFEFLDMFKNLPPPAHNVGPVRSASSNVNPFRVLHSDGVPDSNAEDSSTNEDSDVDDSENDDDSDSSLQEVDPEKQWLNLPDEEEKDEPTVNYDFDYPEPEPRSPDESPPREWYTPDSFAQPPSKKSYILNPLGFFQVLGEDGIPDVPSGDRELHHLLMDGDVWGMSIKERARLHKYWIDQARIQMHETHLGEFERLRERYNDKVREYNEVKEAVRPSTYDNYTF